MSEADIAAGQELAEQALWATRTAHERLERAETEIQALVTDTDWQSRAARAFNDQVNNHAATASATASVIRQQADAIAYAIASVVGTRGGV